MGAGVGAQASGRGGQLRKRRNGGGRGGIRHAHSPPPPTGSTGGSHMDPCSSDASDDVDLDLDMDMDARIRAYDRACARQVRRRDYVCAVYVRAYQSFYVWTHTL